MRKASMILLLAAAAAAQEASSEPGQLGVVPAPLDPETRQMFRIPAETATGVVLSEILPGSAAAAAGMKAGDVLFFLDRQEVKSPDQLRELVRAHRAGDVVTFALKRGGETIDGTLTLGPAAGVETEVLVVEEAGEPRVRELELQLQELRRRVEKRREEVARRHDPLEPWIDREERLLGEAKKAADPKKQAWHEARLDLLRTMRKERAAADHPDYPGFFRGRLVGPGGSVLEHTAVQLGRVDAAERRLERLEKKVDEILELLRHRLPEPPAK
jgi:hypothetical protein